MLPVRHEQAISTVHTLPVIFIRSATNETDLIVLALLSFRMISDTRIECRNANTQRETAGVEPAGSDRSGVESRGPGSIGLDGFLWSLRQRGSHLPSLRHQSADVLSLATAL